MRRCLVCALRSVASLTIAALLLGACSAMPNLDPGGAGCQSTTGPGPPSGPVPFREHVLGLAPRTADQLIRSAGHVPVFNVQIPGYGECWCEPPPEGTVVDAWWGGRGQVFVQVDGVDEGHTADDQPLLGWGC